MKWSHPVRGTSVAVIVWLIASFVLTFAVGKHIGSIVLVLGSILVYLTLALSLKTDSALDFYVAGRNISPFANGAATGAAWMSAASYLSLAGVIALMGYDAMPFIIGWTLGYSLMAFTIVPFVRKSNTYTVPELLEKRGGGWGPIRSLAVIIIFLMYIVYLTAQYVGIGVIFSRVLGMQATLAVFIGVLGSLTYIWVSGWKGITWIQFLQYFVMLTMYCTPVFIAAYYLDILPLPHLAYGELIEQIEANETLFGLQLWTEPFTKSVGGGKGPVNWIFFAVVLMLGTMGLPHILIRFYTVKSVNAARMSVGWALLFITLLYTTATVYASMARYGFSTFWGKPIQEVMNAVWVEKWLPSGLIRVIDRNADGILQPSELIFHSDIVVLGMPDMFGMFWLIAPLVAVGGLAAALSTADGLLLSMSTAISRDIYTRFVNSRATDATEIMLIRILLVIIGFVGAIMAYAALKDPKFAAYVVMLVGWAFVIAASTFTPTIILGIFWKRLNRYGMFFGMIAGLFISLPYIILVGIYKLPPIEFMGNTIGTISWGMLGFLGNIIVSIVVSLLTKQEGAEVERFVDSMRLPD